LAATATTNHTGLYALLVIAAVLWLTGYLFACWLWPFTTCRRCAGTGRQLGPGRHILNHLRDLHDKGSHG
jgi:hypothetical protein